MKKYCVLAFSFLMSLSLSSNAMRLIPDNNEKSGFRVEMDPSQTEMVAPTNPVAVGVVSGALGAAAGAVAGAIAGGAANRKDASIAGAVVVGAVAAGYYLIENHRYRKVYDTSDGKNLHGAAANNNEQGVKAQLDYAPCLGFAGYHFDPVARDSDHRLALSYAAATDADDAAKALLHHKRMPKEVSIVRGTKKEVSHTRENISWWARIWYLLTEQPQPVAKDSTTNKESSTITTHKTINDNEPADKKTASMIAARLLHVKVLTTLMIEGADISIKDAFQQNVEDVAARNKEVAQVVDAFKGNRAKQ